MANIQKRGNSYLIRCFMYTDSNGKQIFKTKTWKIPEGMSEKKAEKEARHEAELFEEEIRTGNYTEKNIKFDEFVQLWLRDYAETQLRTLTLERYKSMLPRISSAIGHYYLDKIRPAMLMDFYRELSQTEKEKSYIFKEDFKAILKNKGFTQAEFSKQSGISSTTLKSLIQGKPVSGNTAEKVSKALNEKQINLFVPSGESETLSSKTVLEHHRLISVILNTAVQWQYLVSNPAERVKPPKVTKSEAEYLDDQQAIHLLELLQKEGNDKQIYKTAITVLLFTGMRRGELLGLEWSDIDEQNSTISIQKSVLYTPEKGIFVDETKTYSSKRVIKASHAAIESLKEFKDWKIAEYRKTGSVWFPCGFVFTNLENKQLHPDSLTSWFHDFISKTDLPQIHIHSLRHTNATLQIANGTSITAVASRLGHANSGTTTKIYAHAIKSAEAASAETLDNLLHPMGSIKCGKMA